MLYICNVNVHIDTAKMPAKDRYIVLHRGEGVRLIVTDASEVGRIMGVSRDTIRRLFLDGEVIVDYKGWIIGKGFDYIKSKRGLFG